MQAMQRRAFLFMSRDRLRTAALSSSFSQRSVLFDDFSVGNTCKEKGPEVFLLYFRSHSRVILKRHGEFINTPPPLRGGEETTPP